MIGDWVQFPHGEEITLLDSICVHELQHALKLCRIDKQLNIDIKTK